MNYAFCHFYDKDTKHSLSLLKIYTIQEATRIHILNVQDHFPLECHLEQSCDDDQLFLNLNFTPTIDFASYSKQSNHTDIKYCKTMSNTSSKLQRPR